MSIDGLKEILEGYVDPGQKAVAVNAIGETGLNVRLYSVFSLQAFVMSLSRSQCHRVMRHFYDTYFLAFNTAQMAWVTELLRLMDVSHTRVRNARRENLTVALFHERFQASDEINVKQRKRELELYDILWSTYNNNGFRDFRNRRMFHLDLAENIGKPSVSGDLDFVTSNCMHGMHMQLGWLCKTSPASSRRQQVKQVVNRPGF